MTADDLGIAVAQFHLRQGADRVGADLLKDVVRFDLGAQSGTQLALDEGQQLGATADEEFGQGVRVGSANSGHHLVVGQRHETLAETGGSRRLGSAKTKEHGTAGVDRSK